MSEGKRRLRLKIALGALVVLVAMIVWFLGTSVRSP